MKALARANDVRLAGARFKDELRAMTGKEGRLLLAAWLDEGFSEGIGSLRLDETLRAIRGMGSVKSSRLVVRSGILPGRLRTRLRDLTALERARLAMGLRRWPT